MKCPVCGGNMYKTEAQFFTTVCSTMLCLLICAGDSSRDNACDYWLPCDRDGEVPADIWEKLRDDS